LFAVSVDSPAASRRLKERLKSRFTFLTDPQGVLLDRLGSATGGATHLFVTPIDNYFSDNLSSDLRISLGVDPA
jgi:hypothetical protein